MWLILPNKKDIGDEIKKPQINDLGLSNFILQSD